MIGPATPARPHQSPPPTRSPAPPTKKISDNSTFNILQLNANGIGNKLTELGVVLERTFTTDLVMKAIKSCRSSKACRTQALLQSIPVQYVNKVKMAVIQELKLSPKSKNLCIQKYTTVRKDRSYGQGGGLLIFIQRWADILLQERPG